MIREIMKNKEHNLGYMQYANGNREPIEYIVERNDIYIRVFAKSGEYMAYSNRSKVWKHFMHYIPTPCMNGSFEIDDASVWLVAEDVVNISVIRDTELLG